MKRSTIFTFFDSLLYFLALALPFALLCIVAINGGVTGVQDLIADYTGIFAGTELFVAVDGVIGATGVAPLLNVKTAFFVDWTVYVVYITAFHLLIDCLKFIPEAAHRLMDRLGGDWFD